LQAEREGRCEVLPHVRATPTNREGRVPYFHNYFLSGLHAIKYVMVNSENKKKEKKIEGWMAK
jgi:hypothetical protein